MPSKTTVKFLTRVSHPSDTDYRTISRLEVKSPLHIVNDGLELDFSAWDGDKGYFSNRQVADNVSGGTVVVHPYQYNTDGTAESVIEVIQKVPFSETFTETSDIEISSFPSYPIWPSGVPQEASLILNTVSIPVTTQSDKDAVDSKLVTDSISDWRERLAKVADNFEKGNGVYRWAHEEAKGHLTNPEFHVPLTTTDHGSIINKAHNTALHWPRLIGLAWRVVNKYEKSSYTTFGTPATVTNHSGTTTTLDLTATRPENSGIESLVKMVETEFNVAGKAKPVYFWHYAAGGQEAAWTAYYSSRQVWITNFATAMGAQLVYTAADESDYVDLYKEFKKCLAV